ncbi:oxytocin/vasopressin-like peptide, partial [Asbolus verrucosus]
MSKLITSIILLVLGELFASGCLITNCPRGGKRSKFGLAETAVKPVRNKFQSVLAADPDKAANVSAQAFAVDLSAAFSEPPRRSAANERDSFTKGNLALPEVLRAERIQADVRLREFAAAK